MGRRKSDSESDRYKKIFEFIRNKKYTKDDYEKVINNEEKIKSLFNNENLKKYAEYIPLFFGMIKDTISRKYKEIPKGTLAAITGTLIYVLAPADLIPDFIPGVGFIDDAAIVALCIKLVSIDVEKYKEWKSI